MYCMSTAYHLNGRDDLFSISQIPITVTVINDTPAGDEVSIKLRRSADGSLIQSVLIDFLYGSPGEDPQTGQPIFQRGTYTLMVPDGLTLDDVYLTATNSYGDIKMLTIHSVGSDNVIKLSEIMERGEPLFY